MDGRASQVDWNSPLLNRNSKSNLASLPTAEPIHLLDLAL